MAVNGVNQRDSIVAAQEEVNNKRRDLQRTRKGLQDRNLADYARDQRCEEMRFSPERFKCCRTLSGHTGKIYSLDWAYREPNRIVSASQDGRLIVWNAMTSQKTHAIKLQSQWVMACAFSPDGQAVACGGLDNMLSVFRLRSSESQSNVPCRVLQGHKQYISCCRFVPEKSGHVITSSGDQTCILWDVEANQRVSTFGADTPSGHSSNVMSVSISTENPCLFVSGSCDATAKLWDSRVFSRAQCTFFGHTGDVNAVQFLPDSRWFGTGSDDGTCKLFDTRYGYELQEYRPDEEPCPVTAIAFSRSGRILFVGYGAQAQSTSEPHRGYLWDTMTAKVISDIGRFHNRQVSCMGLAPDGSALCTGSWDNNLKVWASSTLER